MIPDYVYVISAYPNATELANSREKDLTLYAKKHLDIRIETKDIPKPIS